MGKSFQSTNEGTVYSDANHQPLSVEIDAQSTWDNATADAFEGRRQSPIVSFSSGMRALSHCGSGTQNSQMKFNAFCRDTQPVNVAQQRWNTVVLTSVVYVLISLPYWALTAWSLSIYEVPVREHCCCNPVTRGLVGWRDNRTDSLTQRRTLVYSWSRKLNAKQLDTRKVVVGGQNIERS